MTTRKDWLEIADEPETEEERKELDAYAKAFAADPENFVVPDYIHMRGRTGRPKLNKEKVVTTGLALLPAQAAWLKAQPEGMSAAARALISAAMDAEAPPAAPALNDFD